MLPGPQFLLGLLSPIAQSVDGGCSALSRAPSRTEIESQSLCLYGQLRRAGGETSLGTLLWAACWSRSTAFTVVTPPARPRATAQMEKPWAREGAARGPALFDVSAEDGGGMAALLSPLSLLVFLILSPLISALSPFQAQPRSTRW